MNTMLSFEEVKSYLDLEEDELEKFLKEGKIHAYRIGGTYIRFRKEEIETLRYEIKPRNVRTPAKRTVLSSVYDFWRFNNFYIISVVLTAAVIYWWVATF